MTRDERVSAACEGARRSESTLRRTPSFGSVRAVCGATRQGHRSSTHVDAVGAGQTLRPNRVFSVGSTLPTLFGALRAQHDQAPGDVALTPDVAALHCDP